MRGEVRGEGRRPSGGRSSGVPTEGGPCGGGQLRERLRLQLPFSEHIQSSIMQISRLNQLYLVGRTKLAVEVFATIELIRSVL